MEDENADRVYVPGANTNPPPPARDVEPFWAPEELAAPVHGGRPVPHEAPPAVPVPHPNGVYRPMDRPIPVPPPAHVPVPMPPIGHGPAPIVPPAQIPAQRQPTLPAADAIEPPTQAWPNLERQPPAAPNGAAPSAPPADKPAAPPSGGEHTPVAPTSADPNAPSSGAPTSSRFSVSGPGATTPNSGAPDPGHAGASTPDSGGPSSGDPSSGDPSSWPAGASTPDSGAPGPWPVGDNTPSSGAPAWDESGVHTSPDSPWSQPPQRPTASAAVPAPATPAPGPHPPMSHPPMPHPHMPHPPGPNRPANPARATASAHVPDPETPNGAIYRPPAHGAAPANAYSQGGAPPPTARPPEMPGPYPPTMDPRAARPHANPAAQNHPHGPAHPQAQTHPAARNHPHGQAHPQAHPAAPSYPPAQIYPPPPGYPQHPAAPQPAPQQFAQAPLQPQPAPPTTGQPAVDPFQDLPWVSDGTPTAEEFARRRLAKPAEPTATMGPRALLKKTTLGLVKLAPGKRELEYKQDVDMVRRNFGGLRQVTVVNPKGGAGKTVAVLLLAMTFGQKRGGYVLAWDNNETQGTLGMRAQQDFHARTVRDMMRDLQLFHNTHGRVGDLSQYVRAQGEGMFDVLASDESATAGEMLTAGAFAEIREIVSRFYKLIFVDTGNNVRAQNWQAAMDATDQLVITMSARNDSAETAARMLDHLEQSGRQRLVRQAVSVVSMPPTRKDIDLPAIERHFAARTRAVLLAPYERLIDSGEPLRYGQLSTNTKDAWLKIAAAVAEGL